MNKGLLRKLLARNVDTLTLFYCQKPITGYGVIVQIQSMFNIPMSCATVYGCLMRLERDDLLDHTMIDGKNGRRVMSYIISEKGRVCLVESVRGLQFLLQILSNGR